MQAMDRAHLEQSRRRPLERVSTAPSTCIPMQLANMQSSMPQLDSQGRPVQAAALRSDCWNSPLCPRNMPQTGLTQGIPLATCGGGSHEVPSQAQQYNSESGLTANEISIQSPATAMSNTSIPLTAGALNGHTGQSRPSMKRARTTNSTGTDIKPDVFDDASPMQNSPASVNTPNTTAAHTGGKEKRLPHHVIERRYRENLNSQIESLRAAVPSTSACLTLDMEDIGNANAGSAIRPLSKAAVIAHAAEYMRQLSAQNEEVERMNRELRVTVEALRRLVNCEDCGVVQQIVDAGA